MANKYKCKIAFLFLLIVMIALSSCKMKAEQKSLTLYFDTIDSCIEDGDFQKALKELKKAESAAYDSWSYIGIYKRYNKIGEDKRSEKILKKALKKNSHNEELVAVYSNFLLRHDRLNDAAKLSEELRGSKYGSLYSEAVLRIERKNHSSDEVEYFKDKKFYPIYLDAYKSGSNSIWLRNCVTYHLREGNFENAASLKPKQYQNSDDAYFWGLVLYDSGKYYDSVDALEVSRNYIKDYPSLLTSKLNKPSEIKIVALESDAYLALSEMDKANDARDLIINKLAEIDTVPENESDILRTIAMNSAIYANNKGDDAATANVLLFLVNQWPTFTEGLILYADFAYESNLNREEDLEVQALREVGLATLEMEKYDNRKKIPISDAIYRIDNAIKIEKNPYLSVIKLDLKYKMDKSLNVQEKSADLWKLIEDSSTEEEKYNTELVKYALSFLLNTNQFDEAYDIFYKYITTSFEYDFKDVFWMQVERLLPKMDIKIAEFAAYFAAKLNLYDETIRLFEYCVYESGGVLFENVISPYVSNRTCMNMANVYVSIGKEEKALDLLGKTAGRENSNYYRSEIFYRIASIYAANGDKKNALKSAEYANSLYPENAKASLLKTKLQNKEN